jgi:hypothetical protein
VCNREGLLLAREVFSAIPDSFGERPSPKPANDAGDESPDLLAWYRDALRACLTHDLHRSRPPGKVTFSDRGCLVPGRVVRLALQFCGVPALLLDNTEQFLVAVFRHDRLVPSFTHPAEDSSPAFDYKLYALPVLPAAGLYEKSSLQDERAVADLIPGS